MSALYEQYGDAKRSGPALFPVPPITVEELLDPTNVLPRSLLGVVGECRAAARNELSSRDIIPALLPFAEGVAAADTQARAWLAAHYPLMSPSESRWVRARVIDDLTGAGPLQPLRRDPRTTEIIVFTPQPMTTVMPDGTRRYGRGTSVEFSSKVAGADGLTCAPGVLFDDDDHVLNVVNWLADNRQPTAVSPRISATLDDGSRLQVVHGGVTDGHTSLALRRHPKHAHTLCDLIEWGALPMEMAQDLAWFVRNRFTMVISGATSSGKTTVLNALLPFVNPQHHLFIVEDTKEIIHPPYLQVSRRVARVAKGDAEAVTIRDHVKDALRFRPDIICIGELRDAAALEAMKAYNTGHEGSATTCHATDAGNTIKRLASMMTESPDMPSFDQAKDLVAAAVDIVVFAKRFPDGTRRVTEVVEVQKPRRHATGLLTTPEIRLLWEYTLEDGFVRRGVPSPQLCEVRGVPWQEDCPVTVEQVRATCEVMRHVAADLDER